MTHGVGNIILDISISINISHPGYLTHLGKSVSMIWSL